ncbi:MAG: hypothetical protein IPL07_09880 [Acidimicrobiaceae bacterium]|nr:hypothetical protein [Acidimicrobiaceae bacterium]
MSREEMREMVRTLGKRSGLKFNDYQLFDMLFSEYGGHPHLTRRACSVITDAIHASEQGVVPYPVTTSDVQRAFAAGGESSPSAIATQTLRAFSRWYPDEADRVAEVIETGVPYAERKAISHAVDFGICSEDGSLRMGALTRRG